MALYIILLIPIAIIAYGFGSMDTLVLASNFVFHRNLLKLGKGGAWLSNFRRIYGTKGILLLAATEIVKDVIPIALGGLILAFKGHFVEGCAFAGFCLVVGRLWPIFYNLKGSHATVAMIVAGMFIDTSLGIATAVIAVGMLIWTKRLSLSTLVAALAMAAVSVLLLEENILIILAELTAGAVILKHIPQVRKMLSAEEKIELKEDLSYKFDETF